MKWHFSITQFVDYSPKKTKQKRAYENIVKLHVDIREKLINSYRKITKGFF